MKFYEEFPTKECWYCGELCQEYETVCPNCGEKFEETILENEVLDMLISMKKVITKVISIEKRRLNR